MIHVVICLLLALVVLMQRPKQEGLGAAFGAGMTDAAFGAKGLFGDPEFAGSLADDAPRCGKLGRHETRRRYADE